MLAQVFAAFVEANTGGYVVRWGTRALINTGLAQSKKRSGLGWFSNTAASAARETRAAKHAAIPFTPSPVEARNFDAMASSLRMQGRITVGS